VRYYQVKAGYLNIYSCQSMNIVLFI